MTDNLELLEDMHSMFCLLMVVLLVVAYGWNMNVRGMYTFVKLLVLDELSGILGIR